MKARIRVVYEVPIEDTDALDLQARDPDNPRTSYEASNEDQVLSQRVEAARDAENMKDKFAVDGATIVDYVVEEVSDS